MKDWNLSDEVIQHVGLDGFYDFEYVKYIHVKEFIRRLKEFIPNPKADGFGEDIKCQHDLIDKLAGEKLI